MLQREDIIRHLQERLQPQPYLYALWMEGSDASESADEYSDLDFWLDFEDVYEQEAISDVEQALKELAELDYCYVIAHEHPKIRQRIYHLKGTPRFLTIDFCWQLHSRDMSGLSFAVGDRVESAKVLFDKGNVVKFTKESKLLSPEERLKLLNECDYRYDQHNRVEKYILREEYPEAYACYNRYVIEPLVTLLRLQHTPSHTDYGLVHISRHIPSDQLRRLRKLLQFSSLRDLEDNMREAQIWYAQLRGRENVTSD